MTKWTCRTLTWAALTSSLFAVTAASAATINVTTPSTVSIFPVNDTVIFSGNGSLATFGHSIESTTTTTNLEVIINNTGAAKEIVTSGTGTQHAILFSSSNAANAFVTVAEGVVIESDFSVMKTVGTNTGTGIFTLNNAGTLRTLATGHGFHTQSAGTGFNITNSGLIDASNAAATNGISTNGSDVASPYTITNTATGRILGRSTGIQFGDGATATGVITISNAGLISGTTGYGITLGTHGVGLAHSVTNLAGGIIQSAAQDGFYFGTSSNAIINNAGLITTSASSFSGVNLQHNINTLTNTGIIESQGVTATSYGINVGGLVNTLTNGAGGIIRSTGGTALFRSGGAAVGTITNLINAGQIIKGSNAAARAIDLTTQPAVANFTNLSTGVVTGDIYMPTAAVANVTISGGTLNGLLVGGTGQANTLTVNGNYTTTNPISFFPTMTVSTAGTVFKVATPISGVNTAINVNADTKLQVLEGGSITGTAPTINQAGILSFVLGAGINTTSGAATDPATSNGYINLGSGTYNASGKVFEITRSTGYVAPSARFYVLRGSKVSNGASATLAASSTGNTPLLTFVPKSDATGLYIEASVVDASTVALPVEPAVSAITTPVLTTLNQAVSGSNPVTALQPTVAGLQSLSSTTEIATEALRLAPTVSGDLKISLNFSMASVGDTVMMHRLAHRREEQKSYAAGAGRQYEGAWGQYLGGRAIQNERFGINGFESKMFGFALGADRLINDNLVLGVSGGFAKTGVDTKDAIRNRVDSKAWIGVLYGAYGIDERWFIDGSLLYGRHQFVSKRKITVVLPATVASARYYANYYAARGMLGVDFAPGILRVTPMLGLQLSNFIIDKYTETGGSTNLSVQSQSTPESTVSLGGRVRTSWGRDWTMRPEVHAFAHLNPQARGYMLSSQFAVNGSPVGNIFTTQGPRPAKFSGSVGMSLMVSRSSHWYGMVQYDYTARRQYESHIGGLTLRYVW